MHTPSELMYEIISQRDRINLIGSRLDRGERIVIFDLVSLPVPQFVPAELGFIRTVSWLYVLLSEAGHPNVDFLTERFGAYHLESAEQTITFAILVQQLRTYLQHNLNPGKEQNRNIQDSCEHWFREHCLTPIPGNDDHWRACLIAILNQAIAFLKALHDCVRHIERDESCLQIMLDWRFRIKRTHPPHEFDRIIAVVVADMGREKLNPSLLRKRYYDKWTKELKMLQGDYNFDIEARKLVEAVLLTETSRVLPITGADIMQIFGLPPGPEIGKLLKKARHITDTEPCGRDELLEKLRRPEM